MQLSLYLLLSTQLALLAVGFKTSFPSRVQRISYHNSKQPQFTTFQSRTHLSMLHDPLLDLATTTLQSIEHISTAFSFAPENAFQYDSFLVSQEDAVMPGGVAGYSNLSLYFTLGLYLLTLPGLYSLVTRSVKVTPVRRVYDLPGPANPTAKTPRQMAAEVMAFFKALNYEVTAAEDVITFRGVMGRSNSQAAFLTFCTFIGLGSVGLVLSILLPDVGAKAYLLTLLSPYAGIYYWNNAQRDDEVVIKMETSDDEQMTSIFAQGGKEELERFSRALELQERGKVYVKGLFDDADTPGSDAVATAAAGAALLQQAETSDSSASASGSADDSASSAS